jgi:hypothetical protein
MLPQWTKLMKDITVNRIKRKRTAELGAHLTRLRAFKCWKKLMVVDRTKPVTPLAVAIMHYSTVLLNKVLHAWHDTIRERGHIMRFRNKLFQSWRRWAPKHKQMRKFNDQAEELIRIRRVQRAYGVMIKLCFNVIGTRTEKIKELRRNFCDRRVVICAYALLHKVGVVLRVVIAAFRSFCIADVIGMPSAQKSWVAMFLWCNFCFLHLFADSPDACAL